MVWYGDADEEKARSYLHALAVDVTAGLEACGISVDAHGGSASNAVFVRSVESWQRVARRWIERPTREQALMLVSVFVDGRPVWGIQSGNPAQVFVVLATHLDARRPQTVRSLTRAGRTLESLLAYSPQ